MRRSGSARPSSGTSGPRRLQNGCCICDSNDVWGSGCSVVRGPTPSRSPFHNHYRCCDGKSLKYVGSTSTRTEIRGRNERSSTSELAENNLGVGAKPLRLMVTGVLHAFAEVT